MIKDVVRYEDPYHETEYHLEWSVTNVLIEAFSYDQKSDERVSPMRQ